MPSNHRLIKFCGASLVVHLVVWLILGSLPADKLVFKPSAKLPVEIVYRDRRARQFVHQVEPDQPLEDNQKTARFDSAKRVRVKQETRAPIQGNTIVNGRATKSRLGKLNLHEPLTMPTPTSEGPGAKSPPTPDQGKLLQINPGFVASENNRLLPEDLKLSNATVLNTDRYMFYSFYDRLERQIVPRWSMYVRQTRDRAVATHTFRMGEWTTVLEVLYSPQGDFVRAIVLQQAGWEELDEDALAAFRSAARIPNPPPEMVRPDGYIHVLMGLTVLARPAGF